MYRYGKRSKTNLDTCHEDLQTLFNEVIKHYDITIVCGYRDKETQDKYFDHGSSKLKYPMSKHNSYPSTAVDFVCYVNGRVSWNEVDNLAVAGFIEGLAVGMGIPVRCGFRWDKPFPSQNGFKDYFHIELKE
jgi:hypothetical protein